MKNKRRGLIVLGLIASTAILGIGYAVSTITLNVGGTLSALPNSSFDVYFSAATADTPTSSASSTASITADTKVAAMTTDLTNLNDTQTVTFTIKNASETGIAAKVDSGNVLLCQQGTYDATSGTCTTFTSSYFDVTMDLTGLSSNIASGSTANFTVTTKLIKVNAGLTDADEDGNADNIVEKIDVVLKGISPVQE